LFRSADAYIRELSEKLQRHSRGCGHGPGDAANSPLFQRITSQDEDEVMPPPESKKQRLTPAQITLFKRWINQDQARYTEHWSFRSWPALRCHRCARRPGCGTLSIPSFWPGWSAKVWRRRRKPIDNACVAVFTWT
jgi:hypothetical protein